jgi:hypothetical protein
METLNKIGFFMMISNIIFLVGAIAVFAGDGLVQFLGAIFAWLIFIFSIVICIFALMSFSEDKAISPLLMFLALLELVALVLLTKPWFQPIGMFFVINPAITEAILLSCILAFVMGILGYMSQRKYRESGRGLIIGIVTLVAGLLIFVISFSVFASINTNGYLATTLDVTEIQELPAVDPKYIRTTPMKVADKYATDAIQYPQHTPYVPPDVTMINGTPYWAYTLIPNGMVNEYNLKAAGAVFVDMSTIDKRVEIKDQDLKIAPGLAITDEIYWNILMKNYWVDCERPMTIVYEYSIYIAVPYIEYETHFAFPVWYTVPVWGGVFVVDPEGNINDLSPEEARESLILKGQKIFPEKLVLTYMESQKYWKAKTDGYWGGAMNVWFDHKEEIEITDVSSQGNQQPFLLNTVDGLKWTISTEPWGAANGIFRIYLLDARTGDISYKKYSGTEIGPVNACDYAKKNHPEVDWSQFHVVEPIPVTPDGILYWEVRVVPDDGSGISYVAFVDPKTGATVEFTKDKEIVAFLRGTEVPTDNQTNTTKYTYVTGTVTDIDEFVQNGNTRWILDITGDGNVSYVVAKAELLNLIILEKIADVKIGDNVTAMVDQNSILMAIKVNQM